MTVRPISALFYLICFVCGGVCLGSVIYLGWQFADRFGGSWAFAVALVISVITFLFSGAYLGWFESERD
jgi:hypothetical protein